ncbi:MAG: redoxin domain-containing protein [Deltaproteobacteria bacterium]|nr:redoxin domain-containing protein [Deltaproteobacteria bacterium]
MAAASQFTVSNLQGKTLSLDKLLDTYKVVVLNFWGLRCGACIEEMPRLNEIYKKYRENIVILGINVDAVDGDFLEGQIDKMGFVMDYEVVPDPEFTMADLFQMTAAPLTVVIDSDGVIQYRHENYEPGDEKKLEEVIKSLLDGKKVVTK